MRTRRTPLAADGIVTRATMLGIMSGKLAPAGAAVKDGQKAATPPDVRSDYCHSEAVVGPAGRQHGEL